MATFAPAIFCGFLNYDDDIYVYQNPRVRGPLDWPNIKYELTHQHGFLYHPLSLISLTVDHALWGLHAAGYHAENVAIHTVSVLLLFYILCLATGENVRPAIAAALWAVHPLRVESVVWVAERKDVLAMVFALATLLVYVRTATRDDGKWAIARWPRQIAILILLTLSLASKPAFFTLPALMLLLDFWPLRRFAREPWWMLLVEKVPALAVGYVWMTWMSHVGDPQPGTVTQLFPVPSENARYLNAIVSYVRYLTHQVTVTRLATPYPIHTQGWPTWQIAGCAGLLLAITLLCVAQAKRRPWLIVGWLWYCIALVPFSGVRYIGDFSMTNRYSYMPSIGLAIMLTWSIPPRWVRRPERGASMHNQGILLAIGALTAIVTLAVFTQFEIAYWRSGFALFTHSMEVDDGSLAELNVGAELARQGDVNDAIDCFQRSLAFYPEYSLAWNNLGSAWAAKGDVQTAIDCFRKALRYYPQLAAAHRGLGAALLRDKKMDEAARELRESISIEPFNSDSHCELGLWYHDQKMLPQAIDEMRLAVKYSPNESAFEQDLGTLLSEAGRKEEADQHLRRAAQLRQIEARRPPAP